jgi:protein EFR3
VVTSEALYSSSTFNVQVTTLIPPLLSNLQEVELLALEDELVEFRALWTAASDCAIFRSENLRQKPLSPYLDEFRARPIIERRAASIHLHIDRERGPKKTDVSGACLRALSHLFDHSSGGQIVSVMQAVMASLDEIQGWEKEGHCCWLAGKAAEWTQYQFRDTIPTRFVDRLLREQDAPTTTTLHLTLAAMIFTVYKSPTPLVIPTSDVISNLISLVLRRAAIDPADSLVLALTKCIGALGTHVYYADQIHDLASEVISRLVSTEASGLPGYERDPGDRGRAQALRALIAGLVGLMCTPARGVDQRPSTKSPRSEQEFTTSGQKVADSAQSQNGDNPARTSTERAEAQLTKRTTISPETWQDTLNLICNVDFSVRSDYASALVVYLESEVSSRGEYTDGDGVRRSRPLATSQMQQAGNIIAARYGDKATRLLHAIHVYLYILATSPTFHSPAHSPSPALSPARDVTEAAVTVIPATPDASHEVIGYMEDRSSPARSQYGRHSLSLPTRARRLSLVRRIISRLPSRITPSSLPSATASDYRNIVSILSRVHERLPVHGLFTGIPFLLTLSSAIHSDDIADSACRGRIWMIREVVSRVWLTVGEAWHCKELVEMAEKVSDIVFWSLISLICFEALSTMPVSSCIPQEENARTPGQLADPEVPVNISPVEDAESVWSGVTFQAALDALVSSKDTLEATGMDREALHKRLSMPWTAESAFRDCKFDWWLSELHLLIAPTSSSTAMEPQSSFDPLRRDGISPHLRLAPALMHIENLSLQSLARSTRGVGVTDLRDALEGRSSMSNPALTNNAPSVSTLDQVSIREDIAMSKFRPSGAGSRPEKLKAAGGPSEAREMLNKLQIGRSSNGNNLLRAPFPGSQKQEARWVELFCDGQYHSRLLIRVFTFLSKPPTIVPPYKS